MHRSNYILAVPLSLSVFALVMALETSCGTDDCRSGADDCVVRSPCSALAFECNSDGFIPSVHVIVAGDALPGGLDALGAVGDVLLENDRVLVVIDALDHPHYVASTGGAILDLANRDQNDDSLNHIFQATGLLPGDSAHYDSMELVADSPDLAAVIFRGHLDGRERQRIATRYELRPCDPGVRVRTEYVNLDSEDSILFLADGWYWSGREALPFSPVPGVGFDHPSFGLLDIQDVFFHLPFMAAAGHADPAAAYSVVACSDPFLEGFQSEQVSGLGTERRVIPPRGSVVFERFIGVAKGRAVAPAVDVALEVRRQLFGEEHAEISGRVVAGRPLGTEEVRASIQIWSDDTLLTQALPRGDGRFSAEVPAGRSSYRIDVTAFGRVAATRELTEAGDAGDIQVPDAGEVVLLANVDQIARDALVFFHPADEETRDRVAAKHLGADPVCAPLLGAPAGASPACNRVLVSGARRVQVPAGRYDVYATAGPFVSLGLVTIDVAEGETATAAFSLLTLPIVPQGALSADFHVHGAASFDSSIPDRDRVRAFLAASIDVIAATDHDVVYDYSKARTQLGTLQRPIVLTGLETTGHVLWDLDPDASIPLVIGHYNFWPVMLRPGEPRLGAPYDEKVEPQRLFEIMAEQGGLPPEGVRQLNHPWSDPEFGRDLGFPRAISVDLAEPLPDLFLRNAGYDVQEVMNGTNNAQFASYRAFWFHLLNNGIVRAGTANSDSHSLTDNTLGTPRNLVFTTTTLQLFDQNQFNADVKAGHMIGTNGPVIAASVGGFSPSVTPLPADAGAELSVRVTAAPWVPVEELRIVVNGEVVRTLALDPPSDPFGVEEVLRFEGALPLDELLPAEGDAWLVVEAGAPLLVNGDLDCDGVPDTGDNDGDGVIDWRDVDRFDDDVLDARDLEDGEPDECKGGIGPLASPPERTREDPRHHFAAVTHGADPAAFTNPLLFDRDGDGLWVPSPRASLGAKR